MLRARLSNRRWHAGAHSAATWILLCALAAVASLAALSACSGAERFGLRGIDSPSTRGRPAAQGGGPGPAPLEDGARPGWVTASSASASANRCATDPISDVAGLERDPNYVLGYRAGQRRWHATWTPTRSGGELVHRQGIQRLFRNQRNYFFVSHSTRRRTPPGFEVVRMGSHLPWGRTLGSDGSAPRGLPPAEDRVVHYLGEPLTNQKAPDGARWGYDHAGGIQVNGHYLIVPIEHSRDARPAGFRIADLRDPERPRWGALKLRERGRWTNAGAAALTRLSNGAFLAMVFGRDSREVEVFVSTGVTMNLSWKFWRSTWHDLTPPTFAPYQNLQFITGCDGALYLLGTHNRTGRKDWAELWRIALADGQFTPTYQKVAQVSPRCRSPRTRNVRVCSLRAGGGAYVSTDGRVYLYGIERYDRAYPRGATAVRFREFHN